MMDQQQKRRMVTGGSLVNRYSFWKIEENESIIFITILNQGFYGSFYSPHLAQSELFKETQFSWLRSLAEKKGGRFGKSLP